MYKNQKPSENLCSLTETERSYFHCSKTVDIMLAIVLLCITGAFAELEHYSVVSRVDGEKYVREIGLDEDEEYALVEQKLGTSRKLISQLFDFKTGYAATKTNECLVSRTIYTIEDLKNYVAAYVKDDQSHAPPSHPVGKRGSQINDVATLAGDKIAEFCKEVEVYKAAPKKLKRSSAPKDQPKKKCWFNCSCSGWWC